MPFPVTLLEFTWRRPLFLCKKAEGINPGEEFQVACWKRQWYRCNWKAKIALFSIFQKKRFQSQLRLLRMNFPENDFWLLEDVFAGCLEQVAYNHLEQAELKEDIWDVLPEIQDLPSDLGRVGWLNALCGMWFYSSTVPTSSQFDWYLYYIQ